MLYLKLQDKVPSSEIRKRTKIIDIKEYTLKQKWIRARYMPKMDNTCTKRSTKSSSSSSAFDVMTVLNPQAGGC